MRISDLSSDVFSSDLYLDHEFGGGSLFPPPGPARWAAFRLQALGDGIADAAVLWMDETRRPAEQQSDFWKGRIQDKIVRAADALEAEAEIGRVSGRKRVCQYVTLPGGAETLKK